MKYIIGCDFYFEIEANNREDAYEKSWNLIHEKLSEDFDTESSELWIVDEMEG